MNRRKTKGVRFGAGLIAVALAAGLPVAANNAGAISRVEVDFTTAAGINRYDTAAKLALATFAAGSRDAIVLARGDDFADALAGNALAGAVDGPVVLTRPDALPEQTIAAINALKKADGSTKVYILGGLGAISQGVRDAVAALGVTVSDVDDFNGRDRYLTAIKIADYMDANLTIGTTPTGTKTIFLTTGQNFADAVAIGPGAYHGKFPVLLTPSDPPANDPLTDELIDTIRALDIDSVIILGGENAVSAAIQTELEEEFEPATKVDRIGGERRENTAAMIADWEADVLAFNLQTVLLSRKDDFADALAGGPFGGEMKAPILLTDTNVLSEATEDWLDENDNVIRKIIRLGGDAAITRATLDAAQAAAQTDDSHELGAETDAPELQYVRLVADPAEVDSSNLLEFVFDQPVEGTDIFANAFGSFRAYWNTCNGTRYVDVDEDGVPGNDDDDDGVDGPDPQVPVPTGGVSDWDGPLAVAIRGNGNVVRARFPQSVEGYTRATVRFGVVQNEFGVDNIEGAYPIRPTQCPPVVVQPETALPRLIDTSNWSDAGTYLGQNRVSVDFTFEVPGVVQAVDSDYPTWLLGTILPIADPLDANSFANSADLASQFWLVGEQSSMWQGTSISIIGTGPAVWPGVDSVNLPDGTDDVYTVRIFFTGDTVEVSEPALRRGVVFDRNRLDTTGVFTPPGLLLVQAADYTQAAGITVDPDLQRVTYMGKLGASIVDVVRFEFDEAVSSAYLVPSRFALYDEFLRINRPSSVLVVSGTGSRVVEARYNFGLAAVDQIDSVGLVGRLAGGFVDDDAVRGTDTFGGVNNGYNRRDEVGISFSLVQGGTSPGAVIPAGYTWFPDLLYVARTQDSVTGNYRISYIFDGGVCNAGRVWFDLYDHNGTRTERNVATGLLPAFNPNIPGHSGCNGNIITFDGGFGGIFNNDSIVNAKVGGVETVDWFRPNIAQYSVTEGSAIVNSLDPRFPEGWEVVEAQPGL